MNKELEKNIETEIKILSEISSYNRKIIFANEIEKKILNDTIESLRKGLKIINASIPDLLRGINVAQKFPSIKTIKKKDTGLENIKVRRSNSEIEVVLGKEDKEKFLQELSISENLIRRLRKGGDLRKEEKYGEFKASRGYVKLANKFFFRQAKELSEREKFGNLYRVLKKANMDILFESYLAVMLLTTFFGFIASLFITIFLFFFDVNLTWPLISFSTGSFFMRFLKVIWIPIVLPVIAFFSVYLYPITEMKTIGGRINQELPFAVIHMSAISGSGIEPSEIFRIIGLSEEYPYLRKEIRKVLNQINLYGYDLVTSLNNASRSAPSENLAELFSGLATTISSGADLKGFFEKRAETLLLNYRLAREQYTKLVESFLDIYISIVIAAPMVFLLLLVLMSISGIQTGFTSVQLSLISVFGVALINAVFLIYLQIRQPPY